MSKNLLSTQPILGEDLDSLRESLGLNTSEACWLFGLSMTKWCMVARPNSSKTQAKSILSNPTLALLVRLLRDRPDLSPVPVKVDAKDVYERIRAVDSTFDLKRFSVFFGCEASSGYRWITLRSKISPALARLFSVFVTLFDKVSADGGLEEQQAFLEQWRSVVLHEATQRGAHDVFATGRWVKQEAGSIGKPILGEDLDSLREFIGLTTMDACWLYGLSISKWTQIARGANTKNPLDNVTLALLVRVLRENPWACPIQPAPQAQDVYEAMKEGYPAIDRKRMAILFGREASSGYRWLTTQSKIAPALTRLFTIFMKFKAEAGRDPISNTALVEMWENMVIAEAASRGAMDIFRVGRWVEGEERQMIRPRAIKRAGSEATKPSKELRAMRQAKKPIDSMEVAKPLGAPKKVGRPRLSSLTPEEALMQSVKSKTKTTRAKTLPKS